MPGTTTRGCDASSRSPWAGWATPRRCRPSSSTWGTCSAGRGRIADAHLRGVGPRCDWRRRRDPHPGGPDHERGSRPAQDGCARPGRLPLRGGDRRPGESARRPRRRRALERGLGPGASRPPRGDSGPGADAGPHSSCPGARRSHRIRRKRSSCRPSPAPASSRIRASRRGSSGWATTIPASRSGPRRSAASKRQGRHASP